jgi:NO-binding membrane sensor protein with MHYT domain
MTGGHALLVVDYWTYGLTVPGIGLVLSCLSVFLGLRCVSRARACRGVSRVTWLLLGGVAIGAIGIWAVDFLGLLGFTIRGETIRYNVPVTVASMLVAVAFAGAGLLTVGFGRARSGTLLAGGLVTGVGIAVMHYLGMAAMRMPAQVAYAPGPMIGSVVIAIAVAIYVLWASTRLRAAWPTLLAALTVAVAVSAMHYMAMAGVRLYQAAGPAATPAGGSGGLTAQALLVPLIIGIAVVTFLVGAGIALSPTEEAMRYDESLLDDIRRHARESLEDMPLLSAESTARHSAPPASSPPWTFAELRPPPAAVALLPPAGTPPSRRRRTLGIL